MNPSSTALSDAIAAASNEKFDIYVGGASAADHGRLQHRFRERYSPVATW